jgi:hypothetical protein
MRRRDCSDAGGERLCRASGSIAAGSSYCRFRRRDHPTKESAVSVDKPVQIAGGSGMTTGSGCFSSVTVRIAYDSGAMMGASGSSNPTAPPLTVGGWTANTKLVNNAATVAVALTIADTHIPRNVRLHRFRLYAVVP